MKIADLLEYSLLRNERDNRPNWVKQLGIYSILINDMYIRCDYKRLQYKRKLGSFICSEYDKNKEKIIKRFEADLKELIGG